MPRFFFHIGDDPDSEGTEIDSIADAKCQAVKLAGQTICDDADGFWDTAEWLMTVTDDRGLILFHLEIVGVDAPVLRTDPPSAPPS